ncbi:MAG: signal recognition particle receptor subunit alpha, partial [Thiohalocapsa sp.]
MRFWRRNVPNEPTPDADTIPPPVEQPVARPEEPLAEAPPERPRPEEARAPDLPPRTWFDRLLGVPEPSVEPEEEEKSEQPGEQPAAAVLETAPAQPEAARPPAPPPAPVEPPAAAPPPQPGPAAFAPPQPVAEPASLRGWFGRLRAGLSRSSARLNEGINTIFLRRRLDDEALEELEELLIASDMGTGVARQVVEDLRRTRFNQEVAPEEVRMALAEEVLKLVEWVQKPLRVDTGKKPFTILVVGVNGSGKTTTIGKLAKQYADAGQRVMLAAGDTFRAAAVEQLQVWGERAGTPVMTRPTGSDAAGLAYDALEKARADGTDILLIDTAGRLHNKADLMGELQKIVRVLKKVDPAS